MAYTALYRSYRPQNFEEVLGQKNIIQTLKNSLNNNKIAHAYLFSGPRGTGKTTLAKIFAKALNCEEGVGHTCNTCSNCQDITNGSHPDVLEIDAASNNGVEQVRDLIEKIKYQPLKGRYKVYIIDEVHQMSTSAFNALLKTLEEPPANVVFILATTDPNKILPTILSRVQRYDFTKVSKKDIVRRMEYVLQEEKIKYDELALETIASLADGGVRDALSLLDKTISYSNENISKEVVYELFGLMSNKRKLELLDNIYKKNIDIVLKTIKEDYENGVDILREHDSLISILKDLLINKYTSDLTLLTCLTSEEVSSFSGDSKTIVKFLDILVKSRREYSSSSNIFDNFEMMILNMLSYEQNNAVETQVTKPNEINEKVVLKEVATINKEEKIAEMPVKKLDPVKTIDATLKKLIDTGEQVNISDEFILNIMVQGNKSLKEKLLRDWNNLDAYRNDSKCESYVNLLLNCIPRVAANDCLLVEAQFQSIIPKINLVNNQESLAEFFKAVFGYKSHIIAINSMQYLDSVTKFKNFAQIGKLPKPQPIIIEKNIDNKPQVVVDKTLELFNKLKK